MPTDKQTDRFYKAAAKYLKSAGWEALVIGGSSIEADTGKYNFRLVVKFMGGRKRDAKA